MILTIPLPLLKEIEILLRFETSWWIDQRKDLADLTFLLSDARIPVSWMQHPADLSVLTGWFGGPKTEAMTNLGEHELIQAGQHDEAPVGRLNHVQTDAFNRQNRQPAFPRLPQADMTRTCQNRRE